MTKRHRSSDARLVAAAAWGLVLLAAAFRAWSMHGTWFYFDDFPFLVQSVTHSASPAYLMTPYLGHLMPGGRLFAWLATRHAPLDYLPFALALSVGFALAGVGMARLLMNLFGRRWAILPPLTVFLFSPLLLESTLWWAAGINQLPALVAIAWALDSHIRFLRSNRLRHLLASLGWIIVGLLFAELALLTYVFLIVLTLGYFTTGSMGHRVRTIWHGYRGAVVAHSALVLSYVVIYLLSQPERLPPGQSHPLLSYLYDMGAKTFATTASGGPLAWRWAWAAQIEVAPSDLFLIFSWAVLGTLLIAARRSRVNSLRATILVLVLLAVNVLLVSTGRGVFGPAFALDVRFAYNLAPAYALTLGLLFMPVVDARESARRQQRDPWVDSPPVVTIAVLSFVVLSAVSTARFPLRDLGPLSSQTWVTNLRTSLGNVQGSVPMAAGAVPPWVTGAAEGSYSKFLPLVSHRFEVHEIAIDTVYVIDARGLLVPAQLAVARREDSKAGHATGCPFPAGHGSVAIPLDGPVLGVGWLVRVDYRSEDRLAATVTTGGLSTAVELPAGSHSVLLPASAEYDTVEMRATGASDRFCVDHVTVGTLSADQ